MKVTSFCRHLNLLEILNDYKLWVANVERYGGGKQPNEEGSKIYKMRCFLLRIRMSVEEIKVRYF